MDRVNEDTASAVPVNAAGGGAVAGIGVGPQGEPGIKKKLRSIVKRKPLVEIRKEQEQWTTSEQTS